jgi:hypothetical protein
MAPRDHFRAHGRVSVQIQALLRPAGSSELSVKIRDLGFGGAGVEVIRSSREPSSSATPNPIDLAAGTPVVLEVVAPVLWDPLYLSGHIAWSLSKEAGDLPARAGISFDQLGATTLLSLFDILGSD